MSGKTLQWSLIGLFVLVLAAMEATHLHVARYNLFLVILLSLTYGLILVVMGIERRRHHKDDD